MTGYKIPNICRRLPRKNLADGLRSVIKRRQGPKDRNFQAIGHEAGPTGLAQHFSNPLLQINPAMSEQDKHEIRKIIQEEINAKLSAASGKNSVDTKQPGQGVSVDQLKAINVETVSPAY